jgi:peptidoglycan/LPS O-acetylase OafA/YrhL
MGGIRIILALSVVVWHVPGTHVRLLNAAVAVLLFFVISGFYMALVVNEKYAPSGAGWVRRFYLARFLRLYPAYFVMSAVMVAWFWWTGSPNAFTSRLPVSGGDQALIAGLNVFVLGQDLFQLMCNIRGDAVRSYFDEHFFDNWMLVGQAWSLSSEAVFYLLVPWVVRSPLRIIILLVASLAVRTWLIGVMGYQSDFWGYWFVPATLCMFALGSLSYSLYRAVRKLPWSAPVGWCALAAMAGWLLWVTATAGIVLPVNAARSIDEPRFWITYLAFAVSLPFVFVATKAVAVDRKVGDLSYPLYLVHGLVLGLFFIWWGLPEGSLAWIGIAVAASLTVAGVLRLIEIAIERIGLIASMRRQDVGPQSTRDRPQSISSLQVGRLAGLP